MFFLTVGAIFDRPVICGVGAINTAVRRSFRCIFPDAIRHRRAISDRPYGFCWTFSENRRGRRPRRPAAQRKIASPGEKLSEKRSQRTVFLTEEECGRQRNDFENAKTSTSVSSKRHPWWRSVMLYRLLDYCPHSSPDPFGATLPPGEGIFTAPPGRRAGQCPAPTVCPNRVGATLAVARNAGDGVPYGFPFDPRRRNAAQNRFSRGEAVRKTVPKDRFSD